MRLKLLIAYDGAPYAGWQSQAHGQGVQDFVEAAVEKIAGSRCVVHGSGRTDSGVHALGQCAHIEVPATKLQAREWRNALNANLPGTIRILKCGRAPESFHARFSAAGKIYRYLIRHDEVLSPLEMGRVWHVHQKLDCDLLKEGARVFLGTHDFAAFAASRGRHAPATDTRRTIQRIAVSARGSLITLTFQGNGFLYKMVRMLTGALMRVAQGREDLDALRRRLRETGPKWNYVAPAEGLYLVRVLYETPRTK